MKDINEFRIYDRSQYFDRYTIVFINRRQNGIIEALAASERPYHPQGFGQHCTVRSCAGNGKRICFESVPKDVQRFIKENFE